LLGVTGKPPLIFTRIELHSVFNRKISAYFTFAGYLIKGQDFLLHFLSNIVEHLDVPCAPSQVVNQ